MFHFIWILSDFKGSVPHLFCIYYIKAVVPKRCVGRDHEVCREIKKIFKLRLMVIINN
jgi:hypothetical protein